jgi:hypothetical protein
MIELPFRNKIDPKESIGKKLSKKKKIILLLYSDNDRLIYSLLIRVFQRSSKIFVFQKIEFSIIILVDSINIIPVGSPITLLDSDFRD